MSCQRLSTQTPACPGAKLVALKRPIAILILLLVSIDVGKQLAHYCNIRWGRPCTGTRRLRDTVRVPFVYVRRMRSVSLFGSHVSASRPHHALAIHQHEENPRAQTRVALRVQGGPRPVWPQPLGSGLTLPSIEAAGAQPPEHPGRQFARVGASRGLTPFSADAVTEPDSLAPGFGPRGLWGGHRCCPGRPHKRQSASRRRAETTCWNTRRHTLPGLLSQPDRTRHMRCFHRQPVNRGCAHRHLGSAPDSNTRQDSMDRNAGDCSPERPRHGSLDSPRRGQAHAAVPQAHAEGR